MIDRARAKRLWPHLRAALILLHMAAVLTLCTPPRYKVMNPRNWEGEKADAKFRAWAKRLNAIGISTTTDGFRTWWRARAENYLSAREFVGWPATRYAEALYIRQGWSLFSTPKRKPAMLIIEIRELGEWRTLYRARSDQFTWKRRLFDNNRIRKLTGRFARTGTVGVGLYLPVGNWMARLAAEEFPDADLLRTRLWRYETNPPGKPYDPDDGKLTDVRVLRLEQFR